MSERESLTSDERVDLNKLHLAAMDLYRKSCEEQDIVPTCWLAMDDKAKAEQVNLLVRYLSQQTGRNLDTLEVTMMVGNLPDGMLHQWQEAEAVYKRLREEGNPNAFFVGG